MYVFTLCVLDRKTKNSCNDVIEANCSMCSYANQWNRLADWFSLCTDSLRMDKVKQECHRFFWVDEYGNVLMHAKKLKLLAYKIYRPQNSSLKLKKKLNNSVYGFQ